MIIINHNLLFTIYSLFMPWREENELFPDDLEKCYKLFSMKPTFSQQLTYIQLTKLDMFPNSFQVEEYNALIDHIHEQNQLGIELDSELMQQNEDAFDEGCMIDETYDCRDPGELLKVSENNYHREKSVYKRIDLTII